jgi:hypothetical protein
LSFAIEISRGLLLSECVPSRPRQQDHLDIEIVHRRSPSGDAEQISINLQAVPSFEAFGRFVESANPFTFWAQAMQMAWFPWRAAAQAMLPSGMTLPQVEARTRSSDGNAQAK